MALLWLSDEARVAIEPHLPNLGAMNGSRKEGGLS